MFGVQSSEVTVRGEVSVTLASGLLRGVLKVDEEVTRRRGLSKRLVSDLGVVVGACCTQGDDGCSEIAAPTCG